MGLSKDLDALISEISKPDFQLTDTLIQSISEISTSLQDDPEKLIELNMLVGVQLGSREEYAHADEYFMACWPQAHRLNREEGMYAWPWGEEEISPVDTLERIDLYQFIQPFYEHIEPKEYFSFLEFQLRCQEVVGMIRKGEYASANERLLGLFDHIPRSVHVKNDVLSGLRKEFREQRKLDLQMQVFDMGTFYHYLGISYWLTSDLENARINFEESLWFKEKEGHYLDLKEIYSNLGSICMVISDFTKTQKYYHDCIDLIYEKGNEEDALVVLLNLSLLYRKTDNLEEALKYAEKANEIAIIKNSRTMMIISTRFIGEIHQYLGNIETSINYFERSLSYGPTDNSKTLIFLNYVPLLLRENQTELSINYIKEMSKINKENDNIYFEFIYNFLILDFQIIQRSEIEVLPIIKLSNLICENAIPDDYKNKGILQLMKIDIIKDENYYSEIESVNNLFSDNSYPALIYEVVKGKKVLERAEINHLGETEIENLLLLKEVVKENQERGKELSLNFIDEYLINRIYIELVN
ncbi:MAG: tetratricopeptide repeat protein [Candidatus Heimdallarchaeota archaeon]|nr:tetratricopeptide repeat protein [Candidatus Heimdallarchaeota archaeon]